MVGGSKGPSSAIATHHLMAGGASCEDKAPGGNRTRAGRRPFEILLGGIMGVTPARALRGAVLPTIAVTSALLVVTAMPSVAAPPVRPGKVTGLSAVVPKPTASYAVASTWNAASNAT